MLLLHRINEYLYIYLFSPKMCPLITSRKWLSASRIYRSWKPDNTSSLDYSFTSTHSFSTKIWLSFRRKDLFTSRVWGSLLKKIHTLRMISSLLISQLLEYL